MKKKRVKRNEIAYNQRDTTTSNPKYRLNSTEVEIINEYRTFFNECIDRGVDPDTVKLMWLKDKGASVMIKNPNFGGWVDKQRAFKDDLIKSLKDYSPAYKKIKREKQKNGHLLVLHPADVHIGKLCSFFETGQEYNSQLAVKRVLEGVEGILNKSNGFNIDKICLILGNDILHVDTPRNTTTSGTMQDSTEMWYDNFLMAKRLYVDVIDKLINIADVHAIYNPSNHDYMSGFMLAEVVQTHYKDCKNVTFDCSIKHRKYYSYGNSLIGTTHGDGARNTDLGSLMSIEAKDKWASSDFRYFYTAHVHHKTSKDFINVTTESLRSPSPADSWHDRNGYINQPALEGFIHCKKRGQVSRITHYF